MTNDIDMTGIPFSCVHYTKFGPVCLCITKIFSSEDIPIKGERLVSLAIFINKEVAEDVIKAFGEQRIIDNWKQGIFIEYEEAHPAIRW